MKREILFRDGAPGTGSVLELLVTCLNTIPTIAYLYAMPIVLHIWRSPQSSHGHLNASVGQQSHLNVGPLHKY